MEDLIEAANGQPVLIAYWFKHDRNRIIEHLESIGYKFGKTLRDIKDSEDIKLWNAGQLPVALIHPASAGHGLNIQSGGHILIWYGLTWSLELYQQTNARLWRQGQTQTVTIHHIVTKNTVDKNDVISLRREHMIKVLELSASLDGGGVDRLLYDFTTRMMDEIHFDFVVTSETEGILEKDLRDRGSSIFHIHQMSGDFFGYLKNLDDIIKQSKQLKH